MMKPIVPFLSVLCALPLAAQTQGVMIDPSESKIVSTEEGQPILRKFMRDLSSLQEMLKRNHISSEEKAFICDAMVKDLLKQIKGPLSGASMNTALSDIHELGSRKILTPAQVAAIRKQLLLARFVQSPAQGDQE